MGFEDGATGRWAGRVWLYLQDRKSMGRAAQDSLSEDKTKFGGASLS